MRRFVVLATVALVVGMIALPAVGDIDKNPNVESFGPVTCDGITADVVWSPSTASVVGKDITEGGVLGVATSIRVYDPTGTVLLETVFDRPGKGLDGLTVECEWLEGGVLLRADVLFRGIDRP